jgi:regulator of protease activity HflC (stomatin/prohibitin superfamily)
MWNRIKLIFDRLAERLARGGKAFGFTLFRVRYVVLIAVIFSFCVWSAIKQPPFRTVPHGDIGVRTNVLTGHASEVTEGSVLVIHGLQQLRVYPLRDQLYRPTSVAANYQSTEGLTLGVDLTVRYALDSTRILSISSNLPDDVNRELIEPEVQGVIAKVLTRYTVREIFSSKRDEIQQAIATELKPRLFNDGILLKDVQMGKVMLPREYQQGMEQLLAAELDSDKMRFTLELKEKEVKAAALDAEAEKAKRDTEAEAAGNEQIIAAKAQEEAMKHVLPFKQKQIEQRQLEAEADKVSRVKTAEGAAQARIIEAAGEAESRKKLADAESYRVEVVGKAESQQMEREGVLISAHPLLIQKTMADKLSDKISVIIAPPPSNGSFIGSTLLGQSKGSGAAAGQPATEADGKTADGDKE